jgi:hypothetical protein
MSGKQVQGSERIPNYHADFNETLLLKSPSPRAILNPLDTLVDIGLPAEKEVIQ